MAGVAEKQRGGLLQGHAALVAHGVSLCDGEGAEAKTSLMSSSRILPFVEYPASSTASRDSNETTSRLKFDGFHGRHRLKSPICV